MTKKISSKFETILTNLSPNMNPFAQNNPYPFRSLTKLNGFYITGNVKWKATKFILTTKKEQCVRSWLPLKSKVYGGKPITLIEIKL